MKGPLSEYTKDDKRNRENSPKRKSSAKMVDVVTDGKEANNEEDELYKGKH